MVLSFKAFIINLFLAIQITEIATKSIETFNTKMCVMLGNNIKLICFRLVYNNDTHNENGVTKLQCAAVYPKFSSLKRGSCFCVSDVPSSNVSSILSKMEM